MFFRLKGCHAGEHLVEVYLMSVKLRSIHADELGLAANGYAACSAHAGAINHNGVERNICGDSIFFCQQTAELHHDCRPDSEDLVHLFALYYLLYANSHYTLLAIRTIVSHDDDLIRMLTHLILENNEILGASGQHTDYSVAGSLERFDNRQHRCHTNATSGAYNGAEVLDVRGLAERSHYVGELIAHIEVAEFCGAHAHFLHYESNGACLCVGISYSERHTFAFLSHAHDDEMSGSARFCD